MTGQLTLSGSGDAFVGCDLVASGGSLLASLFTTGLVDSPVSVPIRVLVDQNVSAPPQVAEIRCTVVGGPPGGGAIVATADLLVLPTEAGQIGIGPQRGRPDFCLVAREN
jgi:hypothetical protein